MLKALDNKETATFFIGHKTCPYCRKFTGTLAGVVAETKLTSTSSMVKNQPTNGVQTFPLALYRSHAGLFHIAGDGQINVTLRLFNVSTKLKILQDCKNQLTSLKSTKNALSRGT